MQYLRFDTSLHFHIAAMEENEKMKINSAQTELESRRSIDRAAGENNPSKGGVFVCSLIKSRIIPVKES